VIRDYFDILADFEVLFPTVKKVVEIPAKIQASEKQL